MLIKKGLTFWFNSGKAFFLNRKLIALFIFISLSVNGFAPSAAEVSKYSFVMTVAAIMQKTAAHIINKCDISMSDLASSVYFNLSKTLDSTPIRQESDKRSGKKESSAPNGIEGIIIKQSAFNEKINILKDSPLYPGFFDSARFGNQSRDFVNLNNGLFSLIIIIFLLFIAGIVRRKEISGNINKKNMLTKGFSV